SPRLSRWLHPDAIRASALDASPVAVMSLDWKRTLGEFILAKKRLADIDTVGLFTYTLPRLASTEAKLRSLEQRLGEPLDVGYRAFLLCADGWPSFVQDIDLFGTEELTGGGRASRAH